MPKHIRNRVIIMALILFVALICAMPSFAPFMPQSWNEILPNQGIRLGLDLQGGMQVTLKVDVEQAVSHQMEFIANDLKSSFQKNHIASGAIETLEPGRLRFSLQDTTALQLAIRHVRESFPNLIIERGNDEYVYLSIDEKERNTIETNAFEQCIETIRNRVNQFGVEEPVVVPQGNNEIVVQLAGITETQRALEILSRMAHLEFKLIAKIQPDNLFLKYREAIQSGRLAPDFSHDELNHVLKGILPPGTEAYLEKYTDHATGAVETIPILVEKSTLMTGEVLKTAMLEFGGRSGAPSVGMTFNSVGAKLFERITRQNTGRQLAIILDDVVQSAPLIDEPISGGSARITGPTFTTETAHDLALVLRAGSLPAPVEVIQNVTVGPSLGLDSIHAGLSAVALGAVLVLLFMFVYYHLSGVIANLALLLNLILTAAALSLFSATLTLPGIAGIVLSIGMAVDSNVLIFERMREETARGKSIYASVNSGYDKAYLTIIDSHVTTLITAMALFLFGTGPIKGFAITLSIGVIFNLFTALYGTRVAYDYLQFKKRLKSIRFLNVLGKPNLDFIKFRKAAFILSGILVILGIFSIVQIERGKANLGVELAGGAMIQFKSEKTFGLDEVRSSLEGSKLPEYELQEVPGENLLLVRIKTDQQSTSDAAKQVAAALEKAMPENRFALSSQADIGASVSKDLKKASLIAIVISMAGIIIYLAWRFNRKFGVAAAMATLHDVLVVLGIFSLMGKEITLLIITALLTLAGYSLTDTVVVFDRIRENMKSNRRADLRQVVNKSINEVLGRTIITSGTVILVLIALLVMGGALLHDFALALLIGVVVGTYSSIFVASPILLFRETRSNKSKPADLPIVS